MSRVCGVRAIPLQCGPSSQPSVQSGTPLHSLLMWMHSSVPPHWYSLGGHRDTVLCGPDEHKNTLLSEIVKGHDVALLLKTINEVDTVNNANLLPNITDIKLNLYLCFESLEKLHQQRKMYHLLYNCSHA